MTVIFVVRRLATKQLNLKNTQTRYSNTELSQCNFMCLQNVGLNTFYSSLGLVKINNLSGQIKNTNNQTKFHKFGSETIGY